MLEFFKIENESKEVVTNIFLILTSDELYPFAMVTTVLHDFKKMGSFSVHNFYFMQDCTALEIPATTGVFGLFSFKK